MLAEMTVNSRRKTLITYSFVSITSRNPASGDRDTESARVTTMATMGTKGTKSEGKCRNYRGKRGQGKIGS
jgi:hypothetical protein